MFKFVGKVVVLAAASKVFVGVVEYVLKTYAPEDHAAYVKAVARKKLLEINSMIERNGFTQEEILPL